MLSGSATREEIEEFFSGDSFATEATGCRVVEGQPGHAICELILERRHRNAIGNVMGGAIFTLADFTLAVACSLGRETTVSVSSTIEYFAVSQGTKLIATANVDRDGRSLAFYTVEVADDTGKLIAKVVSTCKRVKTSAEPLK